MDNLPFFTEENKDLLYSLCKDEIFRSNNFNIDNNKKYYKTFGEIMKIVFKHSNNQSDLTTLNKEVLGKTIPYLSKEIEKKQLRNKPLLPPNSLNPMNPVKHDVAFSDTNRLGNLPVSFREENTNIENEKREDVKKNYNRVLSERENLIKKETIEAPNFSIINNNSDLEDPNKLIEEKMKMRDEINKQFNIPDNTASLTKQFERNVNQQVNNNNNLINVSQEQQLHNMNENVHEINKVVGIQTNLVEENSNLNLSVQDFNLSENVTDNLVSNDSLQEFNTYNEKNNDVDPMELYKQFQNKREEQDSEYQGVQNSKELFTDSQNVANVDAELVLQQRNEGFKREEQKFKENMKYDGALDKRVREMEVQGNKDLEAFKGGPDANDLGLMQSNLMYEENKLFGELKNKLFQERKYVNREHLIIINSADRDWLNDANENRYGFQVRFKPERDGKSMVPKRDEFNQVVRMRNNGKVGTADVRYYGDIVYEEKTFKGDQGCGIENIYKNIVSFSLVRVLMPIENFIIPLDNRLFIDYKSLPYIVLRLDEIEGLYAGTNSNTDKSFAKLLWDKDHSSEVIVDDSILNGNGGNKGFARQLKRGFSSMAPMSFEKKTFYPTPLSSLNRLTINLETPYGKTINNHPDVIDILQVIFRDLGIDAESSSYEINEPGGLPHNKTARYMIEIVSFTYFSNRVFRIGDNINIKGFTYAANSVLEQYMNREEGHYIINLEKEATKDFTKDTNEGFIQKIYIPLPVDIDYTSTTTAGLITPAAASLISDYKDLNGTAIYDDSSSQNKTCKMINKTLQTHFVFKIVTREEDINSYMNSSNI